MKFVNRISSIFKIASYQPKLMRSFEIGREQCNSSKSSSLMKFHSMCNVSANSRKMSSNTETQKDKFDKEFDIEDFKEKHFEEVKELFRLYYYSREPQCMMLNLTYEDHKDLLHDSLEEWVEKNVSVIARHRQTGTLVGCCLGTIVTQENISASISNRASSSKYNLKARYNLLVDDYIKNSVDLFKMYNVQTILQGEIGNVDPAYGNRGLLGLMTLEYERKGKNQGCQLAYGIASNIYSQRSMIRRGYKLVHEVKFADIKVDGKQVLDLSKCGETKTSQLGIKLL